MALKVVLQGATHYRSTSIGISSLDLYEMLQGHAMPCKGKWRTESKFLVLKVTQTTIPVYPYAALLSHLRNAVAFLGYIIWEIVPE